MQKFSFNRIFVDGALCEDFSGSCGGESPLAEQKWELVKEESFAEGYAKGIEDGQLSENIQEEKRFREIFDNILTCVREECAARVAYEGQVRQKCMLLVRDTLVKLFPLLEEQWGYLETADFLKTFVHEHGDLGSFRITLPASLWEKIQQHFEGKTSLLEDKKITWVPVTEAASMDISVSWDDGGVLYTRSQIFNKIIHDIEKFTKNDAEK